MKSYNLFFIFYYLLAISWFEIETVEAIVGGEEAGPGEYKYTVSVQSGNVHICSGSILRDDLVVTAAECIIDSEDKFINKKFTVLAGVNDLQLNVNSRIAIDVVKAFITSDFKQVEARFRDLAYHSKSNIAVLKLRRPLPTAENPVWSALQLPLRTSGVKFSQFYQAKSIFSGFGIDAIRGTKRNNEDEVVDRTNTKLKYIQTVVMHMTSCKTHFDSRVDDSFMCAQVPVNQDKKPEGACKGDVGGPLVKDGILIGVLIAPRQNCDEEYGPALYTRVSTYAPFINRIIRNKRLTLTRIAELQNEFGSARGEMIEVPNIY